MQKKQRFIDSPPKQDKGADTIKIVFSLVLAFFVAAYLVKAKYGSFPMMEDGLLVSVAPWTEGEPKMPYLPDISGFTVEAMEAKVPPFRKGRIILDRINKYPEFIKFLEGDAPRHLRLIQRRINPLALIVVEGNYDWKSLLEELKVLDPEGKFLRVEGTVHTLRIPLLVLGGASLAINGQDVSELRLSKQANVFLVNAGDFFILHTKVIGWDEQKNDRTLFDYKNTDEEKRKYRPFIVTWGGGNLYLGNSDFISLGYLKGKSYGLSFSGCTPCEKLNPNLPRATGWVVGNRFVDMFYGFYSYEADDVAIIGNKYIDNIIYGIDPHDRSRRLIIAKNEAYGTKKKHGIIVSREVNDGWIFDNHSHNNKGSGIMIDRTSVNNVIANNISEHNEQDGLTYFESENNVSWGNTLRFNKKNGMRIRNSWDIKSYKDKAYLNGGTAIEVYTTDLSGQETRDFELDPYTQKAAAVIRDAEINANGPAVFKIKNAELMALSNIKIWTATTLFPTSYQYDDALIKQTIENPAKIINVSNTSYPVPVFPEKHKDVSQKLKE